MRVRVDWIVFTAVMKKCTQTSHSEVSADSKGLLPALVYPGEGTLGSWSLKLTEDYPGMYLCGTADGTSSLKGIFPNIGWVKGGGTEYTWMAVTSRENFIARTNGKRSFPGELYWLLKWQNTCGDGYCVSSVGWVPASDASWSLPGNRNRNGWSPIIFTGDFKSDGIRKL